MNKMNESLNKSKLGEIGEILVQAKLMQLGLNVINANTIMANYESVDLICTKPGSKKNVYVQVKTHKGKNFPIGMTLAKCTKDQLERKIKGPWIFVHVVGEGADMDFHYYILTKDEMITLSSESNFWYINQWKSTYRAKPVNLNNLCGIDLKWLKGKGEDDNYKHCAFINPIKINTENMWWKILDEFKKDDGINVILASFKGVVDLQDQEKEDNLLIQFSSLAKRLFCGGYFLVNDKRRIYLEDIEFYYHEENVEGLKDPVMYHTSDHEKCDDLPYFECGSFNCHISGIDVTFESQNKCYRASFLIRGYSVYSFIGSEWVKTKNHEKRPTYLYEDLMMGFSLNNSLNIEWINENIEDDIFEISNDCRLNVSAYLKDEFGHYVKDCYGNYIKEEIEKEMFDRLSNGSKSQYFSYSGKQYKKCDRPWRFYIKKCGDAL